MRQEAIISSDRSHKMEYLEIAGRHGCNLDPLATISATDEPETLRALLFIY
jgi:hypothetical protein